MPLRDAVEQCAGRSAFGYFRVLSPVIAATVGLYVDSGHGGYGAHRGVVSRDDHRAGRRERDAARVRGFGVPVVGPNGDGVPRGRFALVVRRRRATPVAAFRTSFANPQALLLVNTGLLAASMALVAGSLAVYEPGTREFVIPSELAQDPGPLRRVGTRGAAEAIGGGGPADSGSDCPTIARESVADPRPDRARSDRRYRIVTDPTPIIRLWLC